MHIHIDFSISYYDVDKCGKTILTISYILLLLFAFLSISITIEYWKMISMDASVGTDEY